MIRSVSTGDLGLDLLLGGGWRLVERLPGRESATVLLRGGPGTGKTLLSVDVALALAGALKGDVVVACVELLPTEFFAQIEAGRAELVSQWREGPQKPESRVVILPQSTSVTPSELPRIFCGLLTELDPSAPDLVAGLESLHRDVVALNGRPVAFIVDSLIGGYSLGPGAPRQNVDAVMKFAAQEGLGLVLCEETADDAPSVWDFSADTVLSLEHHRSGDRQVMVQKHRYGASAPGSHQLEIGGWRQPRVSPRPDVWFGRHRIHETLRSHGWKFLNAHSHPPLRWIDGLAPTSTDPQGYGCSFAIVSGPNLEVARKLAFGLVPDEAESQRDVVIDLDPLGFGSDGWSSKSVNVHFLPVAGGPNSAVCDLVEYLGHHLFAEDRAERPRRIVIGDVATVASFADNVAWAESIRVIAALVAESGWGIPVIAYDSSSVTATGAGGLAALRWRAELVVEVSYSEEGIATGRATSRPDGTFDTLHWPKAALDGPWPSEIAELARLPGPPGRGHFSRGHLKKRPRKH